MRVYLYRIGMVVAILLCMAATGLCAEKMKVGMASYDMGGGKDPYIAMGQQGLAQANADLGGALEILSPVWEGNTTHESMLRQLVAQDCKVIVGLGMNFGAAIETLARQYPNRKFILVDEAKEHASLDNLLCIAFRDQESAYLAGVAAALKSRSGVVGFVGAVRTPVIERFQAGYTAGVKSVNPKMKVLSDFVGDGQLAFKNAYQAREPARQQIEDGADVIYHAAGFAGIGAIDAAVEKGVLAIGVDVDQSLSVAPKKRAYLLTSTLKRVDTAVCRAVKSAYRGSFQNGVVNIGLKEEGVGYALNAYNADMMSEIKERMEKTKADIISGKIVVPETL